MLHIQYHNLSISRVLLFPRAHIFSILSQPSSNRNTRGVCSFVASRHFMEISSLSSSSSLLLLSIVSNNHSGEGGASCLLPPPLRNVYTVRVDHFSYTTHRPYPTRAEDFYPDYIETGDSHNPTCSQSHRPIIPLHSRSNGNRTDELRVQVYPRVGSGGQ